MNYIYDKSRRPLVDELLKCKDEIRRLHEKMEAREIEFKRQLDESQDMVLELQKELLDSEKEVGRLIMELSDAEDELEEMRKANDGNKENT